MSKKKSITLLSILSVFVAIVLVFTFVRFPIGIKDYKSAIGAIELDYDLKGGTAYTLKLLEDNTEEIKDIDSVIDTLEYRLSELGYTTYSVKAVKSTDKNVKDYDIRIETKTTETLHDDIQVVAAYGEVELYGGTSENPSTEILEDVKAIADAQYLGSISDAENTYYQVSITFTQEGYDSLMEEINGAGVGSNYYFLMKLGDKNLPLNKDTISEDDFVKRTLNVYLPTEALARQYALQMRTGGLAYMYDIDGLEPVSVSSPYGSNVDTKVLIAISVLVVLIMVALIIVYKGLGLIGALSMLLFILGETWLLLAVPGIVLSMGGIVGIMLSTVVTALGVVYVLEKIKTEYANSQKTVQAAIKKGFNDTLMPIIGGGVVSGVLALALIAFTSGLIKSFAATFGIGIVAGVITILLLTRMYFALILPLVGNKEKFLNLNRAEV